MSDKTVAFIDGPNIYGAVKSLDFDVDWRKMHAWLGPSLLRAYYYTAVEGDTTTNIVSIRPLIDWLDYNGYTIIQKPTKEFTSADGRRKLKGNMDIEIAVHAMELATSMDHMILMTGDGDFRSLVEAVQKKGVHVTVVSSIETQPPMCADELRRQADRFIDLAQLRSIIARDRSEMPQRKLRGE